ncbi:hypothetical protein OESDEN_03849 [Oesophagostomum dentatum]|uniref:Uncharacterized protein n=1 Tax=Oesophagostomum dentatum TaxID=61180 RepID=A0A0B1TLD1_OESDE|nr:hypothetical protein OESDEN_03849 [Oesophagostomum dentatum]
MDSGGLRLLICQTRTSRRISNSSCLVDGSLDYALFCCPLIVHEDVLQEFF